MPTNRGSKRHRKNAPGSREQLSSHPGQMDHGETGRFGSVCPHGSVSLPVCVGQAGAAAGARATAPFSSQNLWLLSPPSKQAGPGERSLAHTLSPGDRSLARTRLWKPMEPSVVLAVWAWLGSEKLRDPGAVVP